MDYLRKLVISLVVLLAGPSLSCASEIIDNDSIETLSISVRDIKIYHQWEWRNLSVNLEYSSNASDIYTVKQFVRNFLEEYSNPDDFWEIMNTKLVRAVSEAFPDMVSLKSTLSLQPDLTLRFPRASVVSYEKGADNLKEAFSFTKLNYLICQDTFRSLNFYVQWDMKVNPDPQTDYPDYQWVDEAIEAFFKEHPVSFSKWSVLKPELESHLLGRFPTLSSIHTEIRVVE